MPSLTFIKILGNLKFLSHGLKQPVDFKHPQEQTPAQHYGNGAFQMADMVAIPQVIPPWFLPAEIPNKYYQKACDQIGSDMKNFHDTMLDAVGYAHDMWKMQAKFKSLQVMSVSAIGTPGCLDGPELESFIKTFPAAAAWTGNKAKWRDAVAKGVSKCFKDWQGQVTVPGLPWYPAFAAFPSASAPPMPNVPMPLITCVSAMMTSMTVPMQLAQAMTDAHDAGLQQDDTDNQFKAMHDALATVISIAFMIWLVSQQVMLVLGKGPIPSFAPPYVPVGPVIGGDNASIPGHALA